MQSACENMVRSVNCIPTCYNNVLMFAFYTGTVMFVILQIYINQNMLLRHRRVATNVNSPLTFTLIAATSTTTKLSTKVNTREKRPTHIYAQSTSKHKGTTANIYYVRGEKTLFSLIDRVDISPSNVCNGGKSPFLLITIPSAPQNRKLRDGIRSSWGTVVGTHSWKMWHRERKGAWMSVVHKLQQRVQILFVLGQSSDNKLRDSAKEEASQHGDILVLDFVESYQNLTLKVLSGFKWCANKCKGTSQVMKLDDDTFLNVPVMLQQITRKEMSGVIYGFILRHGIVKRLGKYMVPLSAYPLERYPDLCTGNMYTMNISVARSIVAVSEYFPYVYMEDAFITGILRTAIGVGIKPVPRGQYEPGAPPQVCAFVKGIALYGQKVNPDLFTKIWETYTNPNVCSIKIVNTKGIKTVNTKGKT